MLTPHNALSDTELLSLADRRYIDPLIVELASRLEKRIEQLDGYPADCPECQTDLKHTH